MKWPTLLIAAFFLGAIAPAYSGQLAAECKPARWPFARGESAAALQSILRKVDRPILHRYLVSEVTRKDYTDDGLAFYISQFLRLTSDDPIWRSFYGGIQLAADIDSAHSVPKRLSVSELCTAYQNAARLSEQKH